MEYIKFEKIKFKHNGSNVYMYHNDRPICFKTPPVFSTKGIIQKQGKYYMHIECTPEMQEFFRKFTAKVQAYMRKHFPGVQLYSPVINGRLKCKIPFKNDRLGIVFMNESRERLISSDFKVNSPISVVLSIPNIWISGEDDDDGQNRMPFWLCYVKEIIVHSSENK